MAPWEFHEVYRNIDAKRIPRYPNHYSLDWLEDCPTFDGYPILATSHDMKFLKYTSKINVIHENIDDTIFLLSEGKTKGLDHAFL
jgi:diadenosine tetraphosphatase ApaH/serine/threonine PP2A family protein phosphatase